MQAKSSEKSKSRKIAPQDLNKMKQRLQVMSKFKATSKGDFQNEIKNAISSIQQKLKNYQLTQLYPPYLPKTVTMHRRQQFLFIKQRYLTPMLSQQDKKNQLKMNLITNFILNLDNEFVDDYFQRLRQPYIRRIFNQNYSMKGIDFKKLNADQNIRNQIQSLLSNASQWLIEIQKTQDLLQRIELYFDIKTPVLFQRAKKEGIQQSKTRTFTDSFYSFIRNLSSFSLRKSAKIIQHSLFSAVAPSAIVLTLAIIGGSATLPWQSDLNGKLLITPILALTVPFVLQGLATKIERVQLIKKLEEQTFVLEQVSTSIQKFNQELSTTILLCCKAENDKDFQKQETNLQKYVNLLNTNLGNLTDFNQNKIQQLRVRTEAYFKSYLQIKQEEWTVVIPVEQAKDYMN